MKNIAKLPLFVFCLLLSFNAISGIQITIHKGFKEVNSSGEYVSREEVRNIVGYGSYHDFLCILTDSNNPSSTQLSESDRLERIERFKAITVSAVSLQATGSAGLAVPLPLMSEVTVSSVDPAGASAITVEEAKPVTPDSEHTPFSDFFYLLRKGKLEPEGCRRLRKDFIAFKASAFEQLEEIREELGSNIAETLTELYNFFLENLEYADLEDTVMTQWNGI